MLEFDANHPIPACKSFWEKKKAYGWLYAEPWHFRALMHRPKASIIPEYYQQPALPVYLQWQSEDREVFHRKRVMIPPPCEQITLADYIQQLALTVSEQNEHRDVWIESLRCFLQFLRDDTDLDQQGALEVIFPFKMELRKGYSLQRKKRIIEKKEASAYVVSNLILTYGIMEALDIKQVHYVGTQGANAIGALLSPKYWKESDTELQPKEAI